MSYCSPADVYKYSGIVNAGDDALIDQFIGEAQAAIETFTSRIFEAAADTTRYYAPGINTQGRRLWLDRDLSAITSIVTNADDGSGGTTLAASDYFTAPRNDTPYFAIDLAGSSSEAWEYTDDAEAGIKVTGRWAWSTTPPKDIVFCCKQWATFLYRQKDAQVFDTIAIPDAGIITVPQGLPLTTIKKLIPFIKSVYV